MKPTSLINELASQGISHPQVLSVMAQIPREMFVSKFYKNKAYQNTALPIDCQQTISQPYIVALMTQSLLDNHPNIKSVLEIGTGSGYQTAILATLFEEVWTIERIEKLYLQAKKRLRNMGFDNIHFKLSDGSKGWLAVAPFDAIIVTAACPELPKELVSQLSLDHGILIIPLGAQKTAQKLTLIVNENGKIQNQEIEKVYFVPLISD